MTSSTRPQVSDQLFHALRDVVGMWENPEGTASLDDAKQLFYGLLIKNGWRPPRG